MKYRVLKAFRFYWMTSTNILILKEDKTFLVKNGALIVSLKVTIFFRGALDFDPKQE